LKQISGKKLIKILLKKGWILIRIKGSHHILSNPNGADRLIIPVHGNQPLRIGILKELMKEPGLSESDL